MSSIGITLTELAAAASPNSELAAGGTTGGGGSGGFPYAGAPPDPDGGSGALAALAGAANTAAPCLVSINPANKLTIIILAAKSPLFFDRSPTNAGAVSVKKDPEKYVRGLSLSNSGSRFSRVVLPTTIIADARAAYVNGLRY